MVYYVSFLIGETFFTSFKGDALPVFLLDFIRQPRNRGQSMHIVFFEESFTLMPSSSASSVEEMLT